ncbi:DUF2515 domain-containing protein [Salibacterium aidingense]|uniref:DUF2515 domain-containing protein n=1 Tax=Salibacterium aidingense TaxID=384933 RepID=UPI000415DA9F|nr:DUF2515 domain-containing protein [Salibacterium aidingense]
MVYKHLLYHAESKIQSAARHMRAKRYSSYFTLPEEELRPICRKLAETRSEKSTAETGSSEKALIEEIKRKTNKDNRNNVTRTEAYRRMYKRHRELHWALVAHMVSRNSGWCMTDLKGEWLPRLLHEQKRRNLFQFYETANALIFQDAFPQLLLYEESKKRGENLFHLLSVFKVSRFMKPFWDHFWETRHSVMLTIALIINEQHYIEKRVIQHTHYQKTVLETIPFKGQEMIQLTQVVFPYYEKHRGRASIRLAGLILEHFADIQERIEAGKKMYAVLFGIEPVYRGVSAFMEKVPHTGSRRDYWKSLFTSSGRTGCSYERLIGEKIKQGVPLLYSPVLEEVWEDQEPASFSREDWFHNLEGLRHLTSIPVPFSFDMTGEFCFGLNKLETAALLKEKLMEPSTR